jgi:ribosome maturation factor RimP
MPLANLREIIERTVAGLGYELVDVERAASGLMRVSVDTLDPPGAVGLDDCERVSRQLTHLFAVEQVAFERLEVSSPGLDRPLTRPGDYLRFAGAPVQLQLRAPLQGRRRWRGLLVGLCGETGAERVRLTVASAEAAAAAKARRSGKRPANAKSRRPAADADGAGASNAARATHAAKAASLAGPSEQIIELPLADVEKARLVPQFDFEPALKANGEGRR